MNSIRQYGHSVFMMIPVYKPTAQRKGHINIQKNLLGTHNQQQPRNRLFFHTLTHYSRDRLCL